MKVRSRFTGDAAVLWEPCFVLSNTKNRHSVHRLVRVEECLRIVACRD